LPNRRRAVALPVCRYLLRLPTEDVDTDETKPFRDTKATCVFRLTESTTTSTSYTVASPQPRAGSSNGPVESDGVDMQANARQRLPMEFYRFAGREGACFGLEGSRSSETTGLVELNRREANHGFSS
jgi:hypothetical protein